MIILNSCTSSAAELNTEQSENLTFSIINEKILFIGNSFTYYWNLPSQVEKMSIERGLNWDIKHFTAPSATLKIHWNNPELKSILESETFDHNLITDIKLNKKLMIAGNIKYDEDLENYGKIADFIDLSGGLETSGLKDLSKIEIFLKKVKQIKNET